MIVKILSSASKNFNGVAYNDKKVEKGTGQILSMNNFPSHINSQSSVQQVKNYLKSTASNSRVNKPQFHAVISTRYRDHSAEQLNKIGNTFMQEMRYGNQPYIIVFHNDTENNHIHIVSTRVNKKTGKKINDSFERLKAQQAIKKALAQLKVKGAESLNPDIQKILNYKFENKAQLELLLRKAGFQFKSTSEGIEIYRNGITQAKLSKEKLESKFSTEKDIQRKKQIMAIFHKYKNQYSTTAFKVIDDRDKKDWQTEKQTDPKIDWESEFQYNLRKTFGLEIVFNKKDDKTPFGYTVLDHKNNTVWKGSELMKMKELFSFSENQIDKKTLDILQDYNVSNEKEKEILISFYEKEFGVSISPEMLWNTKDKKAFQNFKEVRSDVKSYLENSKNNPDVKLFKTEDGNTIVIHTGLHFIGDLKSVMGNSYKQSHSVTETQAHSKGKDSSLGKVLQVLDAALDDTYIPQEDNRLKNKGKRKKKNKR